MVAAVCVVFAVDGLSCAFPRCVVYLVRLLLLLYNDFNAAYGIEEKISQQFPEQTPHYDE